MELNLESLGGAAGAALPIPFASQIGSFAGKVLGQLGSLGKKTNAASQSADINKIADANRLTGEQAAAVVAAHCNKSSDRFDDLAKYLVTDNDYFLRLLADYNSSNAGAKIAPGNADWQAAQYTPSAQMYTQGDPAMTVSAAPVPTSQKYAGLSDSLELAAPAPTSLQSNLTGGDLKGIGKAAWDGAVKGASDAAMKTPEGKIAQNEGAKQWLNDNGLIIGLVISVLVGAFTWLISTRKK